MIAFVSKAVQLVFVLHVTNGDFEGMTIYKKKVDREISINFDYWVNKRNSRSSISSSVREF